MVKKHPLYPAGAFTGNWHCVGSVCGFSIQSEHTEAAAKEACRVLNEHNEKHGHAERFAPVFYGSENTRGIQE